MHIYVCKENVSEGYFMNFNGPVHCSRSVFLEYKRNIKLYTKCITFEWPALVEVIASLVQISEPGAWFCTPAFTVNSKSTWCTNWYHCFTWNFGGAKLAIYENRNTHSNNFNWRKQSSCIFLAEMYSICTKHSCLVMKIWLVSPV